MTSRCSGVILAGGTSSRFGGTPKGLLEVGGRRVVDRVIDSLRAAADELLLITNAPKVREAMSDIAPRGDVRPERGSLVGLHSALVHGGDSALVVAWDMPFVSPALLLALRREGERSGAAVIPEGATGIEPLCAYYPRSCLEIAERQLDAGEMRLSAFARALPHRVIVTRDEIARFGAPEHLFMNLNTVTDLAEARLLAEGRDDPHRRADIERPFLTELQ